MAIPGLLDLRKPASLSRRKSTLEISAPTAGVMGVTAMDIVVSGNFDSCRLRFQRRRSRPHHRMIGRFERPANAVWTIRFFRPAATEGENIFISPSASRSSIGAPVPLANSRARGRTAAASEKPG